MLEYLRDFLFVISTKLYIYVSFIRFARYALVFRKDCLLHKALKKKFEYIKFVNLKYLREFN